MLGIPQNNIHFVATAEISPEFHENEVCDAVLEGIYIQKHKSEYFLF